MSWAIVAAAGATIVTGAYAADQAGDAADRSIGASERASERAIEESARQYDQTREDTRIGRETGDNALLGLGYLLGIRQPPSAENISQLEAELAEAQALRERSINASQNNGAPVVSADAERARNQQTYHVPTNDLRLPTPRPNAIPAQPVDISAIDKNIASIQEKLDSAKQELKIASEFGDMDKFLSKTVPGYDKTFDAEDGFEAEFKKSDSYETQFQEGMRAVQNQLKASGMGYGGKALKAAARFGEDYAGTKFNEWQARQDQLKSEWQSRQDRLRGEGVGRLFTLAGYGPVATQTAAGAGANHAQTVGNAATGHAGVVGNAAYQSAGANIAAVNNAVNTGTTLWMYNNLMKKPEQPGA